MPGVLDSKSGKIIGRFVYPRRPALDFSDQSIEGNVSRTVQSAKEDCDINKIVTRALRTGIALVNGREPMYGDFSSGEDYLSLMNRIAKTEQNFMLLPADVREKFGNSPAALFDWLAKEENFEEAAELGLFPKEYVEEKRRVIAEAAEAKRKADEAAAAAVKSAQ